MYGPVSQRGKAMAYLADGKRRPLVDSQWVCGLILKRTRSWGVMEAFMMMDAVGSTRLCCIRQDKDTIIYWWCWLSVVKYATLFCLFTGEVLTKHFGYFWTKVMLEDFRALHSSKIFFRQVFLMMIIDRPDNQRFFRYSGLCWIPYGRETATDLDFSRTLYYCRS